MKRESEFTEFKNEQNPVNPDIETVIDTAEKKWPKDKALFLLAQTGKDNMTSLLKGDIDEIAILLLQFALNEEGFVNMIENVLRGVELVKSSENDTGRNK
jgi:hypothetical protein